MLAYFVQLNGQLQVLIEGGAILVVAWLFTQLIARWPWLNDLIGQYQDEVAAAVAAAVVGLAQNALNLIPPAWEDVGTLAQALLVAVLVALSVIQVGRKVKASSRNFLARHR